MGRKPVSPADAEILQAYRETGSLKAAGKVLGISPATVHDRVKAALGVGRTRPFTEAERDLIRAHYDGSGCVDLNGLARLLGRNKTVVNRAAASMGLTDARRPKTEAHKQKTGDRTAEWFRKNKPTQRMNSRSKAGRRPDLGNKFFRSTWEANYARYLNLLVKMGVVVSWEFEPETFWFDGIKRGVRSYLPDFRVFYKGDETPVYVEIKGYFDPKSKTKLKRMAKYHPQVRIELVDAKAYAAFRAKWKSAIPNWE